jgi:hypothetical protein
LFHHDLGAILSSVIFIVFGLLFENVCCSRQTPCLHASSHGINTAGDPIFACYLGIHGVHCRTETLTIVGRCAIVGRCEMDTTKNQVDCFRVPPDVEPCPPDNMPLWKPYGIFGLHAATRTQKSEFKGFSARTITWHATRVVQ